MTAFDVPGDLIGRGQVTSGPRQLADYLDAHPGVPVGAFGWEVAVYPRLEGEAPGREEIDRIAALLDAPVLDNTGTGGHYYVSQTFGRITYKATHIPERYMAAHRALMSYADCVTPAAEVTA